MNLLIINPHLSTGGCPQYLYKFLVHNKNKYTNIKVVEFTNFSNEYVIQKNKIKQLIGADNVVTLGDFWVDDITFRNDKFKIIQVINNFRPDIIWFNEFPECFEYKSPPTDLMHKIYSKDRKYKIIETTHNNSFDFSKKLFIPDEFMFCSELYYEKSQSINIKKSIWEVPIENHVRPDRALVLKSLNLDPSFIHVLNVGIINSNKNQKYIFDLAEKLKYFKVQFHFIGNSCFLNECGITDEQLSLENCKVWGERSDVDVFMSCMDLFLFPSHNELNPLSVKEALSWNMDVICKRCDNYVHKYIDKPNFYLLENINVQKFILDKLINLYAELNNNSNSIKFGLYTSFYNCAKYVDKIFDQIKDLNYENYVWYITDDFSTDNTKTLIIEKLKQVNNNKIKYVEQKFKKQMYWQPNTLVDKSCEYIVLIDADDLIDRNFLNIYNKYLSADRSIYLLTSDCQKRNEEDNSLHSMTLVKNDEQLKYKINKFHPYVDYLNNLNYYCFGTLRCFKNIPELNFIIEDFDACAEDSYRCMFVNSFGRWLHLPRNLYTWIYRTDSESHQKKKNNFNANFNAAYTKLLDSQSIVDNRFNDLYKETCSLNYLDINSKDSISIFTKNKNTSLLTELFYDKILSINNTDQHDIYIFILNDYSKSEVQNIISEIKNKNAKILFYHLLDEHCSSNEEKDNKINSKINKYISEISEICDITNWYSYIRHFYMTSTIKKELATKNINKNFINVVSFDPAICKLDYQLSDAPEGVYTIEVCDNSSNLLLHKENIHLYKNLTYWTCFEFNKPIIKKDISIIFKKDNEIVYEKDFIVNEKPVCNLDFLNGKDFNKEVEASPYIEIFVKNQYNKYNITVDENDVVVDIGANVGAFINYALGKKCKKIYACEPNSNCLSIINKYFNKDNNIVLCDYAISDKMGMSYLRLNPDNKISGSAKLIESTTSAGDFSNQIEVKTNTFKNFINNNKIHYIDFLKVDCEGGENFIFTEQNMVYIASRVKKLAIEYHNEFKNKIISMLTKAGFTVFEDVFEENLGFIYAEKRIDIINESGSLGDFLAWTPVVSRYAKEKNIKVNFYTPYKNVLQKSYPNINFFDYADQHKTVSNNEIKLGCFSDIDWQSMTLQEVACHILKIKYIEEKPIIHSSFKKKKFTDKKYVCIATQSTSQCKYWNNPEGWDKTVDYLKSLNYEVVCIDRHEIYGIENHFNKMPSKCINRTGDFPLEDRINDLMHCEFFIGLGSGLSWLAWACDKPVIMISGFSHPKSEFYTPYRVHNSNVCNSCWNDNTLKFDRSNWLWCPRNKNFECSKQISFEMVKEKIDILIKK